MSAQNCVAPTNSTTVYLGVPFALAMVAAIESSDEWRAYRDRLVSGIAPVGPLEEELAERVAELLWRIKRPGRYEASRLTNERPFLSEPSAVNTIQRHEGHIDRALYRALSELRKLRKERNDLERATSPRRRKNALASVSAPEAPIEPMPIDALASMLAPEQTVEPMPIDELAVVSAPESSVEPMPIDALAVVSALEAPVEPMPIDALASVSALQSSVELPSVAEKPAPTLSLEWTQTLVAVLFPKMPAVNVIPRSAAGKAARVAPKSGKERKRERETEKAKKAAARRRRWREQQGVITKRPAVASSQVSAVNAPGADSPTIVPDLLPQPCVPVPSEGVVEPNPRTREQAVDDLVNSIW